MVHVEPVEERETFLEIHADPGGERIVTVIEVLSLTNKSHSAHGRARYLRKQQEILDSEVHLVEIDLLRGGLHSTAVPEMELRAQVGELDYHVCVHRFDQQYDFLIYPIQLRQALPTIVIPLLPDEALVSVELQMVLDRCYDTGLYQRPARYDQEVPPPPLREGQAQWAEQILRDQGIRSTDPSL